MGKRQGVRSLSGLRIPRESQLQPSCTLALPVDRICESINCPIFPDQFKLGFVTCNQRLLTKYVEQIAI